MIRQATIDKLHDMRLSAMADAFENQCNDTKSYEHLSFEDRFGMLVDKEWDKRKSTKLQKIIRDAGFRYPNACVEDIEYHADRNLDKSQMLEFSTCRYIADSHHIILKGASGNGKTYIACALGIAACKNFIKASYVRLPDLLNELAVAHGEGTFEKVIKSYQKINPQIAITSWTPSTRQSSCRFGQVHLQRLHPGFGIPEFFSEDSYTRSRYLRFVGL